ncbi:MAG: hypothetical protein IPK83_17130 [Planctomycetes bacterium]|nr:hypothetical protein [Planctomycetota bacterium]
MSAFSELVAEVVSELAPPKHRPPIECMGLRGGDLIKLVDHLVKAGFAPAAHVIAAVLPTVTGHSAAALRKGMLDLDPSLAGIVFAPDGVNNITLKWLLSHGQSWARAKTMDFLGRRCNPVDYEIVEPNFQDSNPRVRVAAYKAAIAIAPQRIREVLLTQLNDPHSDSRAAALETLSRQKLIGGLPAEALRRRDATMKKLGRQALDFDSTQFAIESIPQVNALGAAELFEWVHKQSPHRLADAAVATVKCHPGSEPRLRAIRCIREWCTVQHLPELEHLAKDPNPVIQRGVMGVLMELMPEQRRPLTIRALRSSDLATRHEALKTLRDDPDPLLVPDLLKLYVMRRTQFARTRWPRLPSSMTFVYSVSWCRP